MMKQTAMGPAGVLAIALSTASHAQPPGITREMIEASLPEEGAPAAVTGPYQVESAAARGSPGHIVFRPADLSAFGNTDTLPVMVWGNGGCAINSDRYAGFLSTIASHGFLVLATAAVAGEEPRQSNMDDLRAAIDWAGTENNREGSALQGKIDTQQVAVMGQSCGGFLAVGLGADPRVDSIGVFNSGVSAPAESAPRGPFPTTAALTDLHGPALFINGAERDFMMEASLANFELIEHVPVFYGARDNAGHTATVDHPGGGEFANVASNWLLYHFKDDAEAGEMFVGEDCELCVNENWDTRSKGLE